MGFKRVILFLMLFLGVGYAHAGTYYIAPTGNDTTGDGTSGNPYKTFDKCWSVNSDASVTVRMAPGAYNYAGMEIDSSIDRGSSWTSSTTIIADTLYGSSITLSGALDMTTNTTYYMEVRGVNFIYSSQKELSGHKFKFIDCAFIGGSSSGNSSNLALGTNNFTPGITSAIIQDCLVIGPSSGSGRYQVQLYNGYRVKVDGVIAHSENGYACSGCGNPSANFVIYNSVDCHVMNSGAVDEVSPNIPDYYQAGFYLVANEGQPQQNIYSSFQNSFVYNTDDWGMRVDGGQDISSATIRNIAVIDTKSGGISFGAGTESRTIYAKNITAILPSTSTAGSDRIGYGAFDGGGTKTLIDSIAANWVDSDYNGITPSFFDTYNNGSSASGTGKRTFNPRTNGLQFLLRIEQSSVLASTGSNSGVMGADIRWRYGIPGTFVGDTDWQVVTSTPLFPWKNEDILKRIWCTYSTSGICATTQTITQYVHGGTSPYTSVVDVTTPTPPTNLSTTSVTSTTMGVSYTQGTDASGIATNEVDLATDSGFSSIVPGYNDLDIGLTTTYTFTGLSASTTYYFRVRAKDPSGNTSDSSATGSGITSAAPTPSSIRNSISGFRNIQGIFR